MSPKISYNHYEKGYTSIQPSSVWGFLGHCYLGTMKTLFKRFDSVAVYLDNILITGPNFEIHLDNFERILANLEEVSLQLNNAKCKFMTPCVEYLGYIQDKDGLHHTHAKVQAILREKTYFCNRNTVIPGNTELLREVPDMPVHYIGTFKCSRFKNIQ